MQNNAVLMIWVINETAKQKRKKRNLLCKKLRLFLFMMEGIRDD